MGRGQRGQRRSLTALVSVVARLVIVCTAVYMYYRCRSRAEQSSLSNATHAVMSWQCGFEINRDIRM